MLRLRVPLALAGAVSAFAIIGGAAAAGAAGVTGPAFYVDGELYRTVGTPTDFSNTGAPDHSFDTIYAIDGQANVATAAPGDQDFNGGRWRVELVEFNDYAGALADDAVDINDNDILDSAAEVHAAVDGGYAEFGDIVATFECPVIPVPKGASNS